MNQEVLSLIPYIRLATLFNPCNN